MARLCAFEFSRNTQIWQCCHFCTTRNGNELGLAKNWINFHEILHLSWCCEKILMWLIVALNLIFKFAKYKNANIANFCVLRENSTTRAFTKAWFRLSQNSPTQIQQIQTAIRVIHFYSFLLFSNIFRSAIDIFVSGESISVIVFRILNPL